MAVRQISTVGHHQQLGACRLPSPTHPDVLIISICGELLTSPILLGVELLGPAGATPLLWVIVGLVVKDPGLIWMVVLGAADLLLVREKVQGLVIFVAEMVSGLALVLVKV